jgi:hypothetical protein
MYVVQCNKIDKKKTPLIGNDLGKMEQFLVV